MAEKEQKQTVPLVYGAIVGVLKDVKAIAKENKNSQQGFMYRSIDQMYGELHELFAKHGLFIVPEVIDRVDSERTTKSGGAMYHTKLKIQYTAYAEDGSSMKVGTLWGEGMDSGDKGSNKAESVAHKYLFIELFMIPTEEDKDPDGHSPEETVGMPKEKKADTPPAKAPEAAPKKAVNEFANVPELLDAGVGECFGKVFAVLENVTARVVGKKKDKTVTDFHVTHSGREKCVITMWGDQTKGKWHPEQKVTFSNVNVAEYNGKKYMADKVEDGWGDDDEIPFA